jgi:hypothetical protein
MELFISISCLYTEEMFFSVEWACLQFQAFFAVLRRSSPHDAHF